MLEWLKRKKHKPTPDDLIEIVKNPGSSKKQKKDAVKFLEEMSKNDALTPEEEISLARLYRFDHGFFEGSPEEKDKKLLEHTEKTANFKINLKTSDADQNDIITAKFNLFLYQSQPKKKDSNIGRHGIKIDKTQLEKLSNDINKYCNNASVAYDFLKLVKTYNHKLTKQGILGFLEALKANGESEKKLENKLTEILDNLKKLASNPNKKEQEKLEEISKLSLLQNTLFCQTNKKKYKKLTKQQNETLMKIKIPEFKNDLDSNFTKLESIFSGDKEIEKSFNETRNELDSFLNVCVKNSRLKTRLKLKKKNLFEKAFIGLVNKYCNKNDPDYKALLLFQKIVFSLMELFKVSGVKAEASLNKIQQPRMLLWKKIRTMETSGIELKATNRTIKS